MDSRAALVLQMAVDLIAAGGKYQHSAVEDVIGEILSNMSAITLHLDEPDNCGDPDCEACNPLRTESVH